MSKDLHNFPKCSKVPLRVRSNKAFVMDISRFKLWEGIKNDMNRSFPQVLRTGTWTVELQDESCQVFSKKHENLTTEGLYHLKFNSKKNHARLCRSIVLLMDSNGAVLNNVSLLQYHIYSGEDVVNFEVKSHSTTKKDKPFFPSEKSLLHTMKERVTKEPPLFTLKKLNITVNNKVGGN